ncbi:hypothetical protein CGRA01v4_00721 [Colletotrichum graminicola]|nr:hypothetical protein CGRA01v4_00721 [Colletotrichum graminicola]
MGVRSDMHGKAPPWWLLDSGQGGTASNLEPVTFDLPGQGMPLPYTRYSVLTLPSPRTRLQVQYFPPQAGSMHHREASQEKSVMMPPFLSSVQCRSCTHAPSPRQPGSCPAGKKK